MDPVPERVLIIGRLLESDLDSVLDSVSSPESESKRNDEFGKDEIRKRKKK